MYKVFQTGYLEQRQKYIENIPFLLMIFVDILFRHTIMKGQGHEWVTEHHSQNKWPSQNHSIHTPASVKVCNVWTKQSNSTHLRNSMITAGIPSANWTSAIGQVYLEMEVQTENANTFVYPPSKLM